MATEVNIDRDEEGAPIFTVGKTLSVIFHITTGEKLVTQDDAVVGATSITLSKPILTALAISDRIRFGNLVVTLTAIAVVGARSLTVTAITGDLFRQSAGKKVQNVTGWNLEWVMGLDGTTHLITKTTGAGITLTDAANGVITVAISRADTYDDTPPVDTDPVLVAPGAYRHALARTDAGNEALLAEGDIEVFQTISV